MNLVIYIIMGLGLEDRLGRGRFLAVFLVSGIMGTLLHSLAFFGSPIPVVGASGAVFGIMGAYATLYPRDRVFFFFILIIPNVPVYIAATVYTIVELFYFVAFPSPGVAHHAHIGGLLAAVVFSLLLAKFSDLPELEHRRSGRATRGGASAKHSHARSRASSTIKSLIHTDEQERLYQRLKENEDEPELASAWLEQLAATTQCPECGASMKAKQGMLVCTCGYIAMD
jgi:hypothetical protein